MQASSHPTLSPSFYSRLHKLAVRSHGFQRRWWMGTWTCVGRGRRAGVVPDPRAWQALPFSRDMRCTDETEATGHVDTEVWPADPASALEVIEEGRKVQRPAGLLVFAADNWEPSPTPTWARPQPSYLPVCSGSCSKSYTFSSSYLAKLDSSEPTHARLPRQRKRSAH